MARLLDEPIPPSEELYRSISPLDATDGEAVLESAVDLPATSVNRSKYSRPEDVLTAMRPNDTGVAMVRVRDLPAPMTSPSGQTWEFVADDDPTTINNAHAEIRVKRRGQSYEGMKPSSKVFKGELRKELASRMRIIMRPQ